MTGLRVARHVVRVTGCGVSVNRIGHQVKDNNDFAEGSEASCRVGLRADRQIGINGLMICWLIEGNTVLFFW